MHVEPGMMGQTVPLGAGLRGGPRPGWLDQGGPAGADGEVARPGRVRDALEVPAEAPRSLPQILLPLTHPGAFSTLIKPSRGHTQAAAFLQNRIKNKTSEGDHERVCASWALEKQFYD